MTAVLVVAGARLPAEAEWCLTYGWILVFTLAAVDTAAENVGE